MTPVDRAIEMLRELMALAAKSTAGILWAIIKELWRPFWLPISIILIVWVLYEVATRNGNAHYNSKNGFSPGFNRFVGAGTYLLFQALTYAILSFVFGNEIYAQAWPYGFHLVTFLSTGLFLNLTGFWVYWKLPTLG